MKIGPRVVYNVYEIKTGGIIKPIRKTTNEEEALEVLRENKRCFIEVNLEWKNEEGLHQEKHIKMVWPDEISS